MRKYSRDGKEKEDRQSSLVLTQVKVDYALLSPSPMEKVDSVVKAEKPGYGDRD